MVKLKFITRIVVAKQYGDVPLKIIRLLGCIQFMKKDGTFTERFEAIIDTGAHTSTIPKGIWEDLQYHLKTDNAWLSGINDRPECRVPASIGEVTGIIIDNENRHTKPLCFLSFFANTDKVPLILGVAGVLEKYHLYWDYQNNITYLQEKRRR